MYQPKFYRFWIKETELKSFEVIISQSDLLIQAEKNLQKKAHKILLKYRKILEKYISNHPDFLTTLKPYPLEQSQPEIVKEMIKFSTIVDVGPMASVAGAIAEFVGKELLKFSKQIIIENGGDIFLKIAKPRTVGIYAGKSPLSGKIGIEIKPEETPLGISTSSGTVGHSLSFGKADAVVVISKSAILADACATASANLIQNEDDLIKAIDFAKKIKGIQGILAIKNDKLALWGKIKIKRIYC